MKFFGLKFTIHFKEKFPMETTFTFEEIIYKKGATSAQYLKCPFNTLLQFWDLALAIFESRAETETGQHISTVGLGLTYNLSLICGLECAQRKSLNRNIT